MDAVTQGFRCEAVEPEDQRELIDARTAGAKRAARRFEIADQARVDKLVGEIEHDPIGVVTAAG